MVVYVPTVNFAFNLVVVVSSPVAVTIFSRVCSFVSATYRNRDINISSVSLCCRYIQYVNFIVNKTYSKRGLFMINMKIFSTHFGQIWFELTFGSTIICR